MFLPNYTKVISFIFVGLFVLTSSVAFFFSDISSSVFKGPFLNNSFSRITSFSKTEPFDLPDIRLTPIKTSDPLVAFSKDLFGLLPSTEKALVETKLNLSLKGTFPSSDKGEGTAIVAVGGSDEKLLQVGDEVLQGVTLVQVFENHVILDRLNVREILRFLDEDASLIFSSTVVGSSSVTSNTQNELKKPDIITRQFVSEYEKRFKENPTAVLNFIGLQRLENEYRVSQGSPLSQVGFQSGDRIISINGQPVTVLLSNYAAIASVISTGSIKVGILRGQQPVSIRYQFE